MTHSLWVSYHIQAEFFLEFNSESFEVNIENSIDKQ